MSSLPTLPLLALARHPLQMAHLLMLIGLPGSGKSTVAAQLATQEGWQIVSTDRIREQLFGDAAIQGAWPQVWAEVERQLRAIAQSSDGKVIYDATNVRRCHRRQFLTRARSWGFDTIEAYWLDVPLAVCLERNQRRDRQVPVPIICKMYRQLRGGSPSVKEGFDRLIRDRFPYPCNQLPNCH
ncbi:MAG: AAA family ATPase [Cyanobacteria bacterium J06638_22]